MKKTVTGIAVVLLYYLSACNLSVPETVSVVTNANYNYSIGNISQDFSDSFQPDSLFSGLETDHNKIYDYFPGQTDAKLQQYLLTIKVDDVGLEDPGIPAGNTVNLDIPPVTVDFDVSEIFTSIKNVLGESFVNSADFREVPLYIYCAQPAGFSTSEVKGSVTVRYVADDSSDTSATDVLIGDSSTVIPYCLKPELNFIEIPVEAIKNEENEEKKDKNVVDTVLKSSDSSMNGDMKNILNGNKHRHGKVQLEFKLSFSGTTNGEPIGKIGINAYIIIPLKFDIQSIIDIDLKSLAKNESDKSKQDLFNRSEATDTNDIQKYLDIIEKVLINYKAEKNPIVTDSNTHYVVKSQEPYIQKKLDINEDSLKLSNEELNEMLCFYPFNPDLNLNVPSGAILCLPRHPGLVLNMNLSLFTNGTVKILEK